MIARSCSQTLPTPPPAILALRFNALHCCLSLPPSLGRVRVCAYLTRALENSDEPPLDASFLQVKGPSDRLSDRQTAWLRILGRGSALVGVCHVAEGSGGSHAVVSTEPKKTNKREDKKK